MTLELLDSLTMINSSAGAFEPTTTVDIAMRCTNGDGIDQSGNMKRCHLSMLQWAAAGMMYLKEELSVFVLT